MKPTALLAAMAVGAATVWLAMAGWNSRAFVLENVEVRGVDTSKVAPSRVAYSGGLIRGRHLLKIRTARAEEQIERIPWVQEAEVRRVLPSKVVVTIKARQPHLVLIDEKGLAHLVDATGRVLQQGDGKFVKVVDLPAERVVPGATLSSAAFADAVKVLAGLDEGLRKEVVVIKAPSVNRIVLELADGTGIFYGANEDARAKNFAVKALLDKHRAAGQAVASIDVRVPTRAAVLLR